MWFEEFQDGCHGGHLGYQKRTILDLHNAQMLSTKLLLHPTYCLGADNNWRLSRWLPWRPSWMMLMEMSKMWKVTDGHMDEANRPQHKLTWSKLTIEDLQNGCCICYHGYCNKTFLSNSESPCHPNASDQVLVQSDLPFESKWGLKIFKWPPWGPSQILDQNYFSNSESLCRSNASHQV